MNRKLEFENWSFFSTNWIVVVVVVSVSGDNAIPPNKSSHQAIHEFINKKKARDTRMRYVFFIWQIDSVKTQ